MTLDINIRERIAQNKKYLDGDLFSDGKDRVALIKDVVEEMVEDPKTQKSSKEIVIYFEGEMKPMVLSANCNMKNLIKATGTDKTKEWIGKKIQLYGEYGTWFGKSKYATRIRDFAPTK